MVIYNITLPFTYSELTLQMQNLLWACSFVGTKARCSQYMPFFYPIKLSRKPSTMVMIKLRFYRLNYDYCSAQHEISNNVVCATNKASNQPAHTRSLITAIASRLNILCVLCYSLSIIWSFFRSKSLREAAQARLSLHLSRCQIVGNHMSQLICFLMTIWAVTCDFQQCAFWSVDLDEPVKPPFKFSNSKWCSVSSLTLIEYSRDYQGFWTVHMHRLIWGFVGRTYHIVGNLMLWLKFMLSWTVVVIEMDHHHCWWFSRKLYCLFCIPVHIFLEPLELHRLPLLLSVLVHPLENPQRMALRVAH